MMTRLIQRMAFRLLSAGVVSFCTLTVVSPASADPAPNKVRLEAIKVELALLSDSHSYSQPLTVRVQGDIIEVQGTVASEAIRQHVLQLARRSCYLPIQDKIAVVGADLPAAKPMLQSAHDRLVRELGAQADAIKIQAESGRLTLTGKVRSVEDKLHASRTLRGLPGCTGLVNELEVQADRGGSFTLVGHTNQGPQLGSDPTEEAEPISPRVPAQATRPAPVATLPSGLPGTRVMTVQVESLDRGRERTHTVMYVIPTSGGQAAPVEVAERPRLVDRPRVVETPTVLTPVRADSPADAQEPNAWPPAHRTVPATPAPAGTFYQSRPLGNLTRIQATTDYSVTYQQTQPIPTSASRPAEVRPAVATTPAPFSRPVAKKPAVPKVPAAEIVRKVKAACGANARDVRAETGADGVLAVHVYATSGGEQLVTTKLFDVPELAQDSVRVHVHLAQ